MGFALLLLLCVLPAAFAAGNKGTDFRTAEGLESWDYRYDISTLAPGKYNLIIEGRDRAGNTSAAGPYNVYVDPKSDLPVVGVSNPTPGMRVGGDLNIVGTCVDDDGVDRVEVRLDAGEFLPAEGKEFWSHTFDVSSVPDGPHTLSARGIDVNGVVGLPVSISVNLDTQKPLVRMTSRQSGALASGMLTLAGSVEDANGVRSLALSTNNRATFTSLPLNQTGDRKSARFSLTVDTRKLKDGPYVYWFTATDLTGSVGSTAFLFFVDNTSPGLEILRPRPEEKVSGSVTVVGKISELIGIKSLSYDTGEGDAGAIELTPGNPYWVRDFDLRKAHGSSARITFTMVDLAGNRTTRQVTLSLLPDEADLPVVTLRSPAPGGRYGGALLLSGTVRDDDGVKAVQYSLDGKAAVTLPCAETFSTTFGGSSPGRHKLAVHGIDVNDRAGKDALVEFLVTGDPPVVSMDSVTIGKQTTAFRPGIEIARGGGAILSGRIGSTARVQAVDVSFNGVRGEKPGVKQSDKPGEARFDVRVPPTIPFGLVTMSVRATDELGLSAEYTSVVHVTNYTRRNIEPGILLADPRIGPDGTVSLTETTPLAAIFAEETIASLSIDPPTDVVTVSNDGDRIVVSAARPGTSGPVRIRVVSTKNHAFTSPELRFITDAANPAFTAPGETPAISVTSVTMGKESSAFTGGMRITAAPSTTVSGLISAPGSFKSGQSVLQGGATKPLITRKTDRPGELAFAVQIPPDLPYGKIDLRISVIDASGRKAEYATFFYKVEKDPGNIQDGESVSFMDARLDAGGAILLAPAESLAGYFNGRPIKGIAIDPETPLFQAAFEGNFITLTAVSEGLPKALRVRVTTVDGDSFMSEPLSLHCDADAPALTVDTPRTGDWVAGKISLKGSASDPNGIAAVEYAIGPSGTFTPVTLRASGSESGFEAQIDLTDVPDGDVPITVRANDGAGRVRTLSFSVMKDTREPTISLLTPPTGDPVNGLITVAGAVTDQGSVERVEFSDDGTTYTPVEGTAVFHAPVDLSKLTSPAQKLFFRVTDRSGNVAVYSPELNVQQAADIPDVQIQIPQEGDVQRNDFVVSGMVFDDDGVGAISYRIDGGEFVPLPASSSFSIPVALQDITDNEHFIELKAQDVNGVASEVRRATFRISKAEPASKLVSPELSTTAQGIITLAGESSDKNGIGEVSVSFDNGQSFDRAEGREKWTYRLDTRILKDGTYSLIVKAVDSYGTEGLYTTLLNVDNTPPEIVLDFPADGDSVSESLALSGRARDNIALTSLTASLTPLGAAAPGKKPVELPRGGAFSQPLDISLFAPGWYDLSIEGVDKASNVARISRNLLIQPKTTADKIDIWFPINGEDLHGSFTISGRLESSSNPTEAVLLIDGKEAGALPLRDRGFFSSVIGPEMLADGAHTLQAEARLPGGTAVRSESRGVTFRSTGPWIRITSHALGEFVTSRPFIKGETRWMAEPVDPAEVEAVAKAKRLAETRRPLRVEMSLDNGKSFMPTQGREQWQFRLETQSYPDGPVRLMARTLFADGTTAVDETILLLDHTPPQVVLLSPREEGRFNGQIALSGTASDENGIAEVRVAVRTGDKANYEVPGFIQGLYLEGHVLGATLWDFGAGLTFFDDNVKLQAQIGMAPEGRFSGLLMGAKLLANIVRLPFSFFLGPDWDYLSASMAVGANFSYVTNTGSTIAFTDQGLILGAVVAQIEFPIVKIRSWPMFNTYSLYAEYQLWFISSDISAGFINRLAFGARIGLF
jgi:hypothetical protein